jgi:hypothetical protein
MAVVCAAFSEALEGGLVELAKDGETACCVRDEPAAGARSLVVCKLPMDSCDKALIDLGVDAAVDGPRLKLGK